MRDPDEGVDEHGRIVTGARRERVPAAYEPVLTEARDAVRAAAGPAFEALYVYGSVATGQARLPDSDVDLLALVSDRTVRPRIVEVAAELTRRHRHLAREIAIAVGELAELDDDGPDGAAARAFLRHYGVFVAGTDHAAGLPPARATPELAWGFNGDGRARLAELRREAATADDPAMLGDLATRAARKLLLVAASLTSVLRRTWTTDRATGAAWLAQDRPELAPVLERAEAWSAGVHTVALAELQDFLLDAEQVVDAFEAAASDATADRACARRT
jgi:uncharacterized protein